MKASYQCYCYTMQKDVSYTSEVLLSGKRNITIKFQLFLATVWEYLDRLTSCFMKAFGEPSF